MFRVRDPQGWQHSRKPTNDPRHNEEKALVKCHFMTGEGGSRTALGRGDMAAVPNASTTPIAERGLWCRPHV
jgi:hypothetical protein